MKTRRSFFATLLAAIGFAPAATAISAATHLPTKGTPFVYRAALPTGPLRGVVINLDGESVHALITEGFFRDLCDHPAVKRARPGGEPNG